MFSLERDKGQNLIWKVIDNHPMDIGSPVLENNNNNFKITPPLPQI